MEKVKEVLDLIKDRGYNVELEETLKANDVKRIGIRFITEGSCIHPVIYLPDEIDDVEAIAYSVIGTFKEAQSYKPDVEDILGNLSLDNVFLCICNTEKNKEMLSNIIHKDIPDLGLSVYYRLKVKDDDDDIETVRIDKNLMEVLNTNEEELEKVVIKEIALIPLYKYTFYRTGLPMNEELKERFLNVFILSNGYRLFGASIILDNKIMSKIRTVYGEDFYIIPLNVHEVVIGAVSDINPYEMKKALLSIYADKEDDYFLSDYIFIYDGKLKKYLEGDE